MSGTVHDTYVAALQHGIADVPEEAVRLGVVRRPTPWFYPQVDDNLPALGPPAELLDEFKNRHEELKEQGLEDARAHNVALDRIDYDERYLAHLDRSAAAQSAIDRIRTLLDRGTDVVLVCYENTDAKRCHRTLLRERLEP